ncbi:uncharacterized protein PV07_09151 [Cladophialophora immunda]|uniref:Uncharacterized protein n=1 Tax=Cladophialophora immunda TaxID=569365 RepID=A0A0D2ALT6_9EURO|nr:uncharacterized protein PV07_09151 [Cladophialophora immunda]KIW26022.1 hypothetical protein PV07_09151 [Cladophialophora immunda]
MSHLCERHSDPHNMMGWNQGKRSPKPSTSSKNNNPACCPGSAPQSSSSRCHIYQYQSPIRRQRSTTPLLPSRVPSTTSTWALPPTLGPKMRTTSRPSVRRLRFFAPCFLEAHAPTEPMEVRLPP